MKAFAALPKQNPYLLSKLNDEEIAHQGLWLLRVVQLVYLVPSYTKGKTQQAPL